MQRSILSILLTYLLVSSSFSGSGQQRMGSFMAYGPETKYFSNLNFSVCQSKNGYLWIGTQNGVVRFDGKRYKNLFSDYANPDSPSDNNIMDIIEDGHGNLWFAGFYHGVSKYDQRSGKFIKYSALTKDEQPYYQVYRIFRDHQDNLWFATGGRGLARYVEARDSFELFYPEPSKAKDGSVRGDNYVTDIIADPSNENLLWCGSFHGLFSFDTRTKQFTHYAKGQQSGKVGELLINSIAADAHGNLWIGTWGDGIFCFDPRTGSYQPNRHISFPTFGYDLQRVNDSLVYIAALNQGLFQLDINNDRVSNITPPHNHTDPSFIKPDIQRISITPAAGIFIGGNYYIYQQHPAFTRLRKTVVYPDTGKDIIYLNACKWDKRRQCYWIATNKGLYCLGADLKAITAVKFEEAENTVHEDFSQLEIDSKDRVWAIQRGSGLMQWNNEKNRFTLNTDHLPGGDDLLKSATNIKADIDGDLWMVTSDKFAYIDVLANTVELIPFDWGTTAESQKQIRNGELLIDPAGDAWLLSAAGMFHCKRKEKKTIHILSTDRGHSDLPSSAILHGAFNKYKTFWISDQNNGMQVLDWNNYSVLSNHNIASGLPSMQVTNIVADSSGKVWANTVAGLAMFDPDRKKIWQLFNRFDGLEKDYLDINSFITSNNKLVIDQGDGFVIRDPDSIGAGNEQPKLHITSILVNNEQYKDSVLPEYISKISLPYNRNNIDVEFAAMDWVYPFKTSYHVMIEGLASAGSWIPNADAKINLTGLSPGHYRISIRALSGSGVWSDTVLLSVIIYPPFWKTWWFMSLCFILLIGLLYSIYRYRINQLKKLQAMRNSISRNLHDDIGASLSNIRILNELARRSQGNADKSNEYLSKAGDDIQRISESLSDIVWNINPKYDEAENLFIRMKRYAADMLDGTNISYTINFPVDIGTLKLNMGKRRDLYLVFKEAINNLVKYSGAQHAVISLDLVGKHLQLEISDDGVGFDPGSIKSGNGLQNMQQRAQTWKGSLELVTLLGRGTKIILKMPL